MDPTPTFFIDRSLGRRQVAQGLKDAGLQVEIHDDHFDQAAEDTVWLVEIARRGWLMLTKDKNIGYRPLERLAVFVEASPRIHAHADTTEPPYIAKVYRDGRVETWKRGDDL